MEQILINMEIKGNYIDLNGRNIFPAIVKFENGIIISIVPSFEKYSNYILPGFVDSHIHIESSMCTPGSFAMSAVPRGTTTVVSDPHEIGNVLGVEGVKFMVEDAKKVPLRFYFGVPSCVPATNFETSGAQIGPKEVEVLLQQPEFKYLSELMNFPGLINGNSEVVDKVTKAKELGKLIDGHAPGLTGKDLETYINYGISTDHECSTIEEALEKIELGMKIQIREGSAAKNLNALKELLRKHPDKVMLCSDDLHPEMLEKGHINKLVAGLISEGYDLFDVIMSCTVNPSLHYGLGKGIIEPGEKADLIVVDDPKKMNVEVVFIGGEKVFENGKIYFEYKGAEVANKFNCSNITEGQISVVAQTNNLTVIEAYDGMLYTGEKSVLVKGGEEVCTDIEKDILKIVIKDRYNDTPPSIGFINGFGLKRGAFACSIAHDSHNIIAVGTNDKDIVGAINLIVGMKGGLSVFCGKESIKLPLPIAGIMSDKPVGKIAQSYAALSEKVKEFGCNLSSPFMTLSFMALLVIPELKMSDKGLFRLSDFNFTPLFR